VQQNGKFCGGHGQENGDMLSGDAALVQNLRYNWTSNLRKNVTPHVRYIRCMIGLFLYTISGTLK